MASQAVKNSMPISTAGRSTESSGFTLVELAVVVLLLSLFTLLSVPTLNRLASDELGRSARTLSGTIKYLFNEAVLTGREHRLIFDLQHRSYRAQVLAADGSLHEATGSQQQGVLGQDIRFSDLTLPERGLFRTGTVTTRILPVGWIDETIVHLSDGQKRQMTLRVVPLTGTTDIHEGYREFYHE